MFKNVASQSVALFAYDATTGVPKTGLTTGATLAPYVAIDSGSGFGAPAALATTTITEMSATNAPGWYSASPSQGETNGNALLFTGKSSTANIFINGMLVFTDPANYTTLSIDSSGNAKADVAKLLGTAWLTPGVAGTPDVNAKQLGGTAQTGRDVGASVLLSAGTGTGQLDFTSGVVKSNLVQILATALTETAGQIAAAFKKWFDVAAPVGTVNSIPNATAGATGGLFIAGTNAATTITTALTTTFTGNLTGSVASVTARVTANTDQVNGDATAAADLAKAADTIIRGTCSGGTTTTAVVSTLVNPSSLTDAGQLIGRTIIFNGATGTANVQGQASNITGSTTGATPTITFTAMTTAPANGDTFVIV